MSLINGENNETSVPQDISNEEEIMPYSVFLGGSCNPTTWRTDLAIPMLQKLGITYYNPQMSKWEPQLINLENTAKQKAEVLLFVIDDQTRSVSSMIEAAHCIGMGLNVVLVVNFIAINGVVDGEKLSPQAIEDHNRGRMYLMDLARRSSVPVFSDIIKALEYVASKIRQI